MLRNQPVGAPLVGAHPRGAEHPRSFCSAHYPFTADTRAKTTNCRICQPFDGDYAKKARREPTRRQANTTDRTGDVLSAFPGMKVLWLIPLPWHLAYPLNFLTGGKAGQAGVSDQLPFRCLRLRLYLFQSPTTSRLEITLEAPFTWRIETACLMTLSVSTADAWGLIAMTSCISCA